MLEIVKFSSLFLIALFIWLVLIYNKFIKLKKLVEEAWSGVDIQLKRRYDLVPNLVKVVSTYAKHEKETFREVSRLRAEIAMLPSSDIDKRLDSENKLGIKLGNIIVTAEAYPELKANELFLSLQNKLGEIEDSLQMARRYYNGTVRNYNIMVESFPSLIVAKIFSFANQSFYKVADPNEKENPHISLD